MSFKSGDKAVFEYGGECEIVTLKDYDEWEWVDGKLWTVEEEDSQYYYQEKYLRKLTPLEELL